MVAREAGQPRAAQRLLALFASLAAASATAGMPFYTAVPIDARAVDAQTGQPVAGAYVIANWQLVTGSLDGERYKGQL